MNKIIFYANSPTMKYECTFFTESDDYEVINARCDEIIDRLEAAGIVRSDCEFYWEEA